MSGTTSGQSGQSTVSFVNLNGRPVIAVTTGNNSPTYDATDPTTHQRFTIHWSKVYSHYYVQDNSLGIATPMSYVTMKDARRAVNNLETSGSDALSSVR